MCPLLFTKLLGVTNRRFGRYNLPRCLVYLPTWMVDFYGKGKYTSPMDPMGEMKISQRHDLSLKVKRGQHFRSFRQKRVFITHFSTESLWFWENVAGSTDRLLEGICCEMGHCMLPATFFKDQQKSKRTHHTLFYRSYTPWNSQFAPESRPGPKRKQSSSNHPFAHAFAVSFREGPFSKPPCLVNLCQVCHRVVPLNTRYL